LNHIDEWLVVSVNYWIASIVDWDEKQLFNSKNLAPEQNANKGSAFNQNKVRSCWHIDVAKDSEVSLGSCHSCLLDFSRVLKGVFKHFAGLRLGMNFHNASVSTEHDLACWKHVHIEGN